MVAPEQADGYPREVGRYLLFAPFAQGGMGTVHLGRLRGGAGFARTVAIKRVRTEGGLKAEHEFVSMMLDEARLASRIRHTNVVAPLDVVEHGADLLLVMEYVEGETLARLASTGPVPVSIATSIVVGALRGLHAAHEAKSERGRALHIVHRDVSPQNVMVGTDGVARVVDFGVAKAAVRLQVTRDRSVKGKIAYMAPEQIRREDVDRRADIYAAAVVLWEVLVGERLFSRVRVEDTIQAVLAGPIDPPSTRVADVPASIDAVVLRGLERSASSRYATAADMADALERAVDPANAGEVAKWVAEHARSALTERARRVEEIEGMSAVYTVESSSPASASGRSLPSTVALPRAPHATRFLTRGRAVVALLALAVVLAWWVAHWSRRGVVAPALAESPGASASESALSLPSTTIPEVPSSPSTPAVSTAADVRPPNVPSTPTKLGRDCAPAKNCDPPFVVDEAGIKIPKRECLH